MRMPSGCAPRSGVAQGETLIKQGEHGDYFYVIESGVFDAFLASVGKGKQSVKTMGSGESFGKRSSRPHAALSTASRSAPRLTRLRNSHASTC